MPYDGSLKFDTSIDGSGFNKGLNGIVSAVKGVALGYGGKKLFDYIIGSNADMEQSITSFEVMLGSAEKAKTLMSDLQNFANVTPFEVTDLTGASQTLLSFGEDINNLQGDLKMLGDISQGNQEKFKSLALVFGQVQSAGKLMGQDLLQMINVGFNPLQVISQKTGESMADLRKDMEGGKISFQMVSDAMKTATSEGGLFYQSMEKQSKTMTGMISTLKDNFAQFGRDVGEEAFEQIKGTLSELMAEMDKASKDGTLKEVAEEIGNSINTLVQILTGAIKIGWEYRDVLIAGATAMATFKVASSASTAITALSTALKSAIANQLEFNLACEANPYVLVASAIVGITVGMVAMTKRLNEAGGETNGLAEKYKSLNDEAKSLDEQSKSAEVQNDKETASIKVKEERYETLRLQYEKTGQGLDALKQASQDLQSVLPSEINMIDAQTGAYLNLSNTIDAVLAKKYKQAQSDNLEKKAENAYSQIQVLEQQKQDKIDEAAYWKKQLGTIKNGLSSDGYTQSYLEEMANEAEKELKSKTDAFDKSIAKQQKTHHKEGLTQRIY